MRQLSKGDYGRVMFTSSSGLRKRRTYYYSADTREGGRSSQLLDVEEGQICEESSHPGGLSSVSGSIE